MHVTILGDYGSRDFKAVYLAFRELGTALSLYPRVADEDEHLRVLETTKEEINRNIRYSDFVYVVSPEGEVSKETELRIAFADGAKKPVYTSKELGDHDTKEYVTAAISPEKLPRFLKQFTEQAE